jgi:hypothetical protein
MASIERTAHPRFSRVFTSRELQDVYTPTPEEVLFSRLHVRNNADLLPFLVLLKCFLDEKKLALAISLYNDQHNAPGDICTALHISKATLYRHLPEQKGGCHRGNRTAFPCSTARLIPTE